MQYTASDLAGRLAAQIESLAKELLPQGKRTGNEWCAGSVAGEPGESLKVHLSGERAGLWKDFAGTDGGDALDLIAAVRGCDTSEAMVQARAFLGLTKPPGPSRRDYKKPTRPAGLQPVERSAAAAAWLRAHGISEATTQLYRVYAQDDDTLVFPFFRGTEVVHIQYRAIMEKRFWASSDTMPALFGWQAIAPRARTVVICEGMKDAMSWAEYGFPALSVPAGGGRKQASWIESEYDRLERFDKIYVSMDADETGQAAIEEIVERLGRTRCFVVRLPRGYNDINDCLTGKHDDGETPKPVPAEVIRACIQQAHTADPKTLVNVGDFTAEIIEHFYPPNERPRSISSPFQKHAGTFEFIYGATTVLAGWNGSGKTTLAGQFVLNAIRQGVPVCVASLEFRVPRYIGWLVRQGLCVPRPEPPEIERAVRRLGESMWAFSPGGRGEQGSSTIERIIDTWEYSYARYGTRLLILDNLSKICFAADEKRQHGEQGEAIVKLTEFAVRTNTHIIVVAHSRKKMSESEMVGKLDVKGNGAITDLADNVLIISRNKKKEQALADAHVREALPPEEFARLEHQPDAWLNCEKQRHGEDEPHLALWFDRDAKQFADRERGVPVRYL